VFCFGWLHVGVKSVGGPHRILYAYILVDVIKTLVLAASKLKCFVFCWLVTCGCKNCKWSPKDLICIYILVDVIKTLPFYLIPLYM
jgi:hypothetical protein